MTKQSGREKNPALVIESTLRDYLNGTHVTQVYRADRSVRASRGAYRSHNCERVALPITGVHQMELPVEGDVAIVSPQRGDAVWMPSGTWVRPTWELPVKTMTIMIYHDAVQIHLVSHEGGEFDRSKAVLRYRFEHPVPDHVTSLVYMLKSPGTPDHAYPSLILALCHLLLDFIETVRTEMDVVDPLSKSQRLWKTMYAYLEEHISLGISRQELANTFDITPNHLSRLFRQHNNASFVETLTDLRLAHACEELRHTNLRIHEIANSVGIADVNYFCRVFKKKLGCSPGEYRLKST